MSRWRLRWTAAEDEALVDRWGIESTDAIAEHLKRTPNAVEQRGKELGLGGHRHCLVTIPEIMRRGGYSRETVVLGLRTLKIPIVPIPRVAAGGASRGSPWRGVAEEHVDTLMAYLVSRTMGSITPRPRIKKGPSGVWGCAGRGEACVTCGRSDRPHYAKGVCVRCYDKARRAQRVTRERAGDACGGTHGTTEREDRTDA